MKYSSKACVSIPFPDLLAKTKSVRCKSSFFSSAAMDAGSVLLYSGSVFHGGGANVTDEDRIGLNITYALGDRKSVV